MSKIRSYFNLYWPMKFVIDLYTSLFMNYTISSEPLKWIGRSFAAGVVSTVTTTLLVIAMTVSKPETILWAFLVGFVGWAIGTVVHTWNNRAHNLGPLHTTVTFVLGAVIGTIFGSLGGLLILAWLA